jgi:hypothetical protein
MVFHWLLQLVPYTLPGAYRLFIPVNVYSQTGELQ